MSEGTTPVERYEGVQVLSVFVLYSAHGCDSAAGSMRARSLTILREKIKEVKKNRKRVCII